MNFASDNNSGVCPQVMDAIVREAERFDSAYGWDESSQRLSEAMAEVFEREVEVFPVATGTASNSIALAATNPVWGGVVCHADAHISVDECAAPTVIGGGLTLLPLPGEHGRLVPGTIATHARTRRDNGVHTVPLTGLSITQSTEAGTRYSVDQVGSLAEEAHSRDMAVHMDGARFANAVAAGTDSPAELTWRAGVDVLSFGATKGGALAAEAIVVFTDSPPDDVERLRKRSGHLLSKQRFASAQFASWLADDVWLTLAGTANGLARRLGDGLRSAGIELVHPVETNMVFAAFSAHQHEAAQSAGAEYYVEDRLADGRLVVRLVASWSSSPDDVDLLVSAVS